MPSRSGDGEEEATELRLPAYLAGPARILKELAANGSMEEAELDFTGVSGQEARGQGERVCTRGVMVLVMCFLAKWLK